MRLEEVPDQPRRSKYDDFFHHVVEEAKTKPPEDAWVQFPARKPLRTLYEYGRRIRRGTMGNCGPGFEATVLNKHLFVRYNAT